MPHTVWDLGGQVADTRLQERQFVAGIEPGQGIVIGRSREPKPMLVILDAWIEVHDFEPGNDDISLQEYALALGKDPLNTALLLPVGTLICGRGESAAGDARAPFIRDTFQAQGTIWAAAKIAIDISLTASAAFNEADVDVHMDWTIAFVDWWTWFQSWNNLEVTPDGNLVDGDRTYG